MLLLAFAVVVRGSMHAWLNWETLVWHLWPRYGVVSVLKVIKELNNQTCSRRRSIYNPDLKTLEQG